MNQTITFTHDGDELDHFVDDIKSVRALTSLGLKEAKNIVDEFRGLTARAITVEYDSTDPKFDASSIETLRRDGIVAKINNGVESPEELIKTAATNSLAEGNYKLAADLTRLLKREYS